MTEKNDLTLSISRSIGAPRSIIWRCWTDNTLLAKWFCPMPWRVTHAELDVRVGGRMNTVMEGPHGEHIENTGCFLDVARGERLIFTDAFAEDFMPQSASFMTGVVEFFDADHEATTMVWSARHATREAKERHQEMGFETGWNAAADQLDELARSLAEKASVTGSDGEMTT